MKQRQQFIKFPETWDEMTARDWREALQLRQELVEKGKKVSVVDIRRKQAQLMLTSRGIRNHPWNQQYYVLVAQVGKTLDWLWTESDDGIELRWRWTGNLIPSWRRLTGPRDHGQDLQFGEWKQGLSLCDQYAQTLQEDTLRLLAGMLYRPAANYQSTGRWRTDWCQDDQEEWLRRGSKMPRWMVWHAYAWFAFFAEYLTTGTFIIDCMEVTFAPIFKKNQHENQECSGLGLNDVALTLAESNVFGSLDDVERTPLMQVMQKLLHDYNEYKNLKKQMKK